MKVLDDKAQMEILSSIAFVFIHQGKSAFKENALFIDATPSQMTEVARTLSASHKIQVKQLDDMSYAIIFL